jgi:hypothetical protein
LRLQGNGAFKEKNARFRCVRGVGGKANKLCISGAGFPDSPQVGAKQKAGRKSPISEKPRQMKALAKVALMAHGLLSRVARHAAGDAAPNWNKTAVRNP